MKITKILPIALLAIVFASCGAPKGELAGVEKNPGKFNEANPYGMRLVKRGSFLMGRNAQSVLYGEPDNLAQRTVDAFWMDESEITNNEYKQFVYWVRDSIAHTILMRSAPSEEDSEPDEESDHWIRPNTGDDGEERPFVDIYGHEIHPINWKAKIEWNNTVIIDKLREGGLIYNNTVTLNTNRLHYHYSWMNYDEAVLPKNRFNVAKGKYPDGASARVDTAWLEVNLETQSYVICDTTVVRPLLKPTDLITSKIINVYPDTLVWKSDFDYSYNEPLMHKYFQHTGFANYPVVGVTWEQAHAFCRWRTDYFLNNAKVDVQEFRLPTETEWEYAARGGRKMATYPWGSNYVRDAKGCYKANFKPYRGDYVDDTGTAPLPVASFAPNDFGLFDMAGNVAEWTADAYNPSSNAITHDLNSQMMYMARKNDPDILKRKVIKGGSWKDIADYLQCGARTYEYQYESRTYIGFRCVRSYIGSDSSYKKAK